MTRVIRNAFVSFLAVAAIAAPTATRTAGPSAQYLIAKVQRLIERSSGLPLDIRAGAPALKNY